jgi:hypothetical protein
MKIQFRLFPAGQLLLGVLVLSAAASYSYTVLAASAQPPIPRGVAMTSWQENGRNGHYLLQIVSGQALQAGTRVTGVVTTDTNCDADAEGRSHCHNIIELTDGSRLTVIDTHNMRVNRCMSPGERISLIGVDKSWIMGTVYSK